MNTPTVGIASSHSSVGVLPDDANTDQREARVDDGCRLREAEGRCDAHTVDAPFREGDCGQDHERLDDAAGEHRHQHAEKAQRAQGIVVIHEVHEEHRHDTVGNGEIGEVERELQGRLAAVDRQRERCPGDHREQDDQRWREEEPDNERQLTERERLRVAAELDVDDEHLRRREERDEHPPGDLARRGDGPQRGNDLDQEDDRRRHEDDRQQVDAVPPPARSSRTRIV